MLTLDHVRALEERVDRAVSTIARLRAENSSLREELGAGKARVAELEAFVEGVKRDQSRIEEAIVKALGRLESFEDTITGKGAAPAASQPSALSASAQPAAAPTQASKPAAHAATAAPKPAAKPEAEPMRQAPAAAPDVTLELEQEPKPAADDLGIF